MLHQKIGAEGSSEVSTAGQTEEDRRHGSERYVTGDLNTSLVRTARGRVIHLEHETPNAEGELDRSRPSGLLTRSVIEAILFEARAS